MIIAADRLTIATEPTFYPVIREDVKRHLRITDTSEDTLIDSYIVQATDLAQREVRRTFCTTTYDAYLSGWPGDNRIDLIRPPVASVTSIKYTDDDGNESTLATSVYQLVSAGTYGWIGLKPDQVWPSDSLYPGYPIVVRYVAGYTVGNVPAQYKAQVLLWVGVLYERREGVEFLQGGELKENIALQRLRQMGKAY